MKRKRNAALSVILVGVLAGPLLADDVQITSDVVYGHKSGLALTFDVYTPTENANGAGVLFMVSGGWFSFWTPPEKALDRFKPLTDKGFTVFAVRHGSSPKFSIPEAVADVLRGGRIRNAINMPSVDPKDLAALSPYLNLCQRLGSFAQQAASGEVQGIGITYWGSIVDLDAVPLTRAVQKGWLAGIVGDEGVNDVNAPHKLKALGIDVAVTKSSSSADYNELIEVRAISADGSETSVRGTLLGKANDPRIVQVDGTAIEVHPTDVLLVVRNLDKPGILGKLGTVLGEHEVNIANMSLSRSDGDDLAITICELDHEPPAETLAVLEGDPDIREARIARLGG